MAISIYIDADACPVKAEIYRVAERYGLKVYVVSNAYINVPRDPRIERVVVSDGFDAADDWIAERAGPGDIVITADIPLAALIIEKGALALNPRGELYTVDNIKQKLTMRDFMEDLRGSGVHTGGPDSFSQADKQAFANSLDKWLVRV